nr:MAG TPA_asm: hypothetical protein [Caudoviricetes sp.]
MKQLQWLSLGRGIAQLEVRTVSQQLLTGLCSTACFQEY